jgi:hypothetical protein
VGHVELEDLLGLGDDANEHGDDLHPMMFPKRNGSSGVVLILMMMKWKKRGWRSWYVALPFEMIALVGSRKLVAQCIRPMLHSLDVRLVGRQKGEPW